MLTSLSLVHVQNRELWSASKRGDTEAVTSLIRAEVDLNSKDEVRCTVTQCVHHLVHIPQF